MSESNLYILSIYKIVYNHSLFRTSFFCAQIMQPSKHLTTSVKYTTLLLFLSIFVICEWSASEMLLMRASHNLFYVIQSNRILITWLIFRLHFMRIIRVPRTHLLDKHVSTRMGSGGVLFSQWHSQSIRR